MARKTPEKILIVEDEPDMGQLIVALVESEGYQGHIASSGEDALLLAKQERFKAFFLDNSLPGLSGVEVARELRKWEEYRNSPIIFITGYANAVRQAPDFTTLANAIFDKPFDLDEVIDKVNSLIHP